LRDELVVNPEVYLELHTPVSIPFPARLVSIAGAARRGTRVLLRQIRRSAIAGLATKASATAISGPWTARLRIS